MLESDSLSKIPRAETFLEQFMQDIDRRFEVAVKAISIFEQISSEEQLKVSDIFGTLSASDYFQHDLPDSAIIESIMTLPRRE
ncbi:MAG: hypothetical protein U5N58_08130 [Actinomycetota bacterium]|nr:hypothetical protein [Actinomycetota bacterium]